MLGEIGQIAHVVHDVDAAVTFYQNTLGMKVMFQVPGMAFLDCGGVRLMLSLPSSEEFDRGNSVLYFRVADLRAAHDTLRGRGVRFDRGPHLVAEMPNHELWMAFFRDNEHNLLALMSEVRG
jgi:methylmalonyl-CoA/ethylmalonyl-CoA epimerase